jgi:hypothetical protein
MHAEAMAHHFWRPHFAVAVKCESKSSCMFFHADQWWSLKLLSTISSTPHTCRTCRRHSGSRKGLPLSPRRRKLTNHVHNLPSEPQNLNAVRITSQRRRHNSKDMKRCFTRDQSMPISNTNTHTHKPTHTRTRTHAHTSTDPANLNRWWKC